MNINNAPPELRSWAMQQDNKIKQLQRELTDVQRQASYLTGTTQRPVAASAPGRISVNGPTTPSSEITNFYYFPIESGPLVQFYSVSGLIKVSYTATMIVRNTTSTATENVFGVTAQVVKDVQTEGDYSALDEGTLVGWSFQDIRISGHVTNREYKFSVSAVQYMNVTPGSHFCRLNYVALSQGGNSVVSFANRTLVVEPI